jgi:hypothetical protein
MFLGDAAGNFNNDFVPSDNPHKILNSNVCLRLASKSLEIPDTAASGVPGHLYPFVGADPRTNTVNYGQGCYSTCMQPSGVAGSVSYSFHTVPVCEIPSSRVRTLLFLIERSTLSSSSEAVQYLMQSSFFNDQPVNHSDTGHDEIHELPFDASRKFGR